MAANAFEDEEKVRVMGKILPILANIPLLSL
jgi:hypothetical protein